ncbi:MAG: tripartite tricarboxylate transporter TctB family protein [Deltaproteobacteria bacterium]|nr:tripartite tricarboxylate transporter TctB family protein [Deltaproteobacteria bacterium]
MKRADVVMGCLLIGVTGYILYETNFYPSPIVPGAPGPAYFPRGLACTLLLLAVVLFVQGLRAKEEGDTGMRGQVVWKLGCTLILIVTYLALLEIWDTFILTPLLLAPIMVIMGERRIQSIIAVPLIFDLFIYAVFYRIFHVQFPTIYF